MRDVSLTTRRRRERGTVYVLVLAVTTLLLVMGLAGTMIARGEVSRGDLERDQSAVRLASLVALDVTHKRITGETDWRTTYRNDTWSSGEWFCGALNQIKFVDEADGDLSDDNTQPVRMYAKSTIDNAVRIYSVELIPDSSNNLVRNPRSIRQESVSE